MENIDNSGRPLKRRICDYINAKIKIAPPIHEGRILIRILCSKLDFQKYSRLIFESSTNMQRSMYKLVSFKSLIYTFTGTYLQSALLSNISVELENPFAIKIIFQENTPQLVPTAV